MISEEMKESKQAVARVFIALSQNGLRKSRISICEVYTFEYQLTHQNRDDWRKLNALFVDVIIWLQKEQAIYMDKKVTSDIGLTYFEGVQLSAKGTVIVQRNEIATLIDGSPLIMPPASIDNDSSSVMGQLGEFIGSALAGFSKTIVSP